MSGAGTLTAVGVPKTTRSVSLTGSGALTATAVRVAAAALSGSGVLTADFGALNVGADLTGSGTLTATRTNITVNPVLTGSGALSVTVSIPFYRVDLNATGNLLADVTPQLTVGADLSSEGRLSATSNYVLFAYVFRTPTQQVYVRLAGRGLVAAYDQGLTVYRVNGAWRTRLSPGPDELALADLAYQGGYLHQLDDAERAALTDGGFSSSITYEEVSA